MRRYLLILTVLQLICGHAIAADYVAVDYSHGDSFYGDCPMSIGFRLTYECEDPDPLTGISLGFEFTTTGASTFEYEAGDYERPTAFWGDWWPIPAVNDDGLVGDEMSYGELFMGGPVPFSTIPSGTVDGEFLRIELAVSGIGGEFCIDSAIVGTGVWSFVGMTCGEGGGPERPLFLDNSLSDANHPICAEVEELMCMDPVIDTVPDGDLLSVSHCSGASFDFGADPIQLDSLGQPVAIISWDVISGPGTIDDVGYYTIDSQLPGVYDVTIEVLSVCCGLDEYTFQVEFTNDAPSFAGCPIEKTALINSQTVFQLNATDADQCDQLEFSLMDDGGQSGVSVSPGGTFTWDPTPATTGTYSFATGVSDGAAADECTVNVTLVDGSTVECGDVDASGAVDIDDIVYLIAYVFQGGPEPLILSTGNVNCAGGADIDDVVYLINYVFSSGLAPCDPGGDGIPDC